jgi:hypothetical protein
MAAPMSNMDIGKSLTSRLSALEERLLKMISQNPGNNNNFT